MSEHATAEVLIVDADRAATGGIATYLEGQGYRVEAVDTTEKAFNCLDAHPYQVLITELRETRVEGMRVIALARERNPDLCVIVLAETSDVELATEAMRQGAYDFQSKPINLAKLGAVIKRGLGFQRLVYEKAQLRRRLDDRFGLASIIGQSPSILRAYEHVRQASQSNGPVIVLGEAGTGKTHVAQTIHHNSDRRDESFVTLDCRGKTKTFLEEELVGVGGKSRRKHAGRLELADGGTLYVAHAHELPERLYTPLLAALTKGHASRRGEDRRYRTRPRFLFSATAEAPDEFAEFLRELREAHSAVSIVLPPLRERREDIPPLVDHFIQQASGEGRSEVTGISRKALDLLGRYDWPGNVLELKNIVEGMVLVARDGQPLDVLDVPPRLRQQAAAETGGIVIAPGTPLREVERMVIEETMRLCDYKKEACAKMLGIGLRTLYRKLDEYEKG